MSRILSFDHLLLSFSHWAGKQWRDTSKQVEALKVEARRIGIPVPEARRPRRRERAPTFGKPEEAKTWRFEWVTVKGRPQTRYRDVETGRFIKKPF